MYISVLGKGSTGCWSELVLIRAETILIYWIMANPRNEGEVNGQPTL